MLLLLRLDRRVEEVDGELIKEKKTTRSQHYDGIEEAECSGARCQRSRPTSGMRQGRETGRHLRALPSAWQRFGKPSIAVPDIDRSEISHLGCGSIQWVAGVAQAGPAESTRLSATAGHQSTAGASSKFEAIQRANCGR